MATGFLVGTLVTSFFVGTLVTGFLVGTLVTGFFVGRLVTGFFVGTLVTGFFVGTLVTGFFVGTLVAGFFVGAFVAGFLVGAMVRGSLVRSIVAGTAPTTCDEANANKATKMRTRDMMIGLVSERWMVCFERSGFCEHSVELAESETKALECCKLCRSHPWKTTPVQRTGVVAPRSAVTIKGP